MKTALTIENIEGAEAALKDESGRTINWPADLLPAGAKPGDKIFFNIGQDDDLAKNILNEILNES